MSYIRVTEERLKEEFIQEWARTLDNENVQYRFQGMPTSLVLKELSEMVVRNVLKKLRP